ncbi:MAG: hypothetical protein WC058_09035, partial [Phycisphaeraceae bacterium]
MKTIKILLLSILFSAVLANIILAFMQHRVDRNLVYAEACRAISEKIVEGAKSFGASDLPLVLRMRNKEGARGAFSRSFRHRVRRINSLIRPPR